MAERGAIPVELNGVPIPAVSDVQVSANRTVNQNPTTDGVKNTYGWAKFSYTITFKTLADRAAYLRQVGAYARNPIEHNFTYTLAEVDRFTLTKCIAVPTQLGSNQDGDSSMQVQGFAEDMIDEGA